ncbi:hypothetical protein ACV229_40010 [Burkholderia sp. MR1-5-21]
MTNDPERIVLPGTLEVPRDKAGLAAPLALQQAIASIVEALQHDPSLPAHIKKVPPAPPGKVKNPFA